MGATLMNSSPANLYMGAPLLFRRPLMGTLIAYNSLEPAKHVVKTRVNDIR